jgi:hypothetical protein
MILVLASGEVEDNGLARWIEDSISNAPGR